ncbi:MAG: hypothetical protein WEA11_02780 [Acidimicrobiales bacterium]
MHFRQFLLVLGGTALLTLAACGSSTSSSSQFSACSALSAAQIETITSVAVGVGVPDLINQESSCVWRADPGPGELLVLVGGENSASEFEARVADGVLSLGAAAPVEIAGASKAIEFGDFGLVVMVVDDRLEQVHQSLSTTSVSAHRELAAAVAEHSK